MVINFWHRLRAYFRRGRHRARGRGKRVQGWLWWPTGKGTEFNFLRYIFRK